MVPSWPLKVLTHILSTHVSAHIARVQQRKKYVLVFQVIGSTRCQHIQTCLRWEHSKHKHWQFSRNVWTISLEVTVVAYLADAVRDDREVAMCPFEFLHWTQQWWNADNSCFPARLAWYVTSGLCSYTEVRQEFLMATTHKRSGTGNSSQRNLKIYWCYRPVSFFRHFSACLL